MNEKIEELKSALAELESEDGLVRFMFGICGGKARSEAFCMALVVGRDGIFQPL